MYLTELFERLRFFFTACEPVFMNSKLGTQLVFLVYDSPTLALSKKILFVLIWGLVLVVDFGCDFVCFKIKLN